MTPPARLISVSEAARLWGVDAATARRWCQEGKIKGAVRVGRAWIIPEDAKPPATGDHPAGWKRGQRRE